MQDQSHGYASNVVKYWNAKPVARWFDVKLEDETRVARLVHPGDGWVVAVSFATVKGHPEWVRVRSTNWRCEDEPNGVFAVEDARDFYKRLLRAGCVVEQGA